MNFRPGQAEAIVARARQQGRVVAEFGAGQPQAAEPPPGQHPCAHSWCILPRNHLGPCQKPGEGQKPRRAKAPNQTEREYEAMLRRQFPDADIRWEAYVLRLADRATYSPDFSIQHPDGRLEFAEVKGSYVFPKALVKLRIAAEMFNHRFVLAQRLKGGEWKIEQLNGAWTRRNR